MSRLHRLQAKGQSIWLDDLRRALLSTGALERMLREDAVTGVTSNPTIFAKAISASTDYDGPLRELVASGASAQEIYAALVTDDVRGACDVFKETFVTTNRARGFASVEVSPEVAYDVEATIAEVREWSKRVDRDNLFVKVPATPPGITAIERLTAEGLSINVTLIFSLDRYRQVAEGYIAGLESFVSKGGDPSYVQSVASFFVSRVDVEIDHRLDRLAEQASTGEAERIRALKGKAGIANARVAYGLFLELFSGDRWEALDRRGAFAQLPLWASTGVKDPAYRDTMYVEELIAPNSVNTMPESTIRAFQDHGDPDAGPFSSEDIARARDLLAELADVGIDYRDVTEDVLEREGIEKFSKSLGEAMARIDAKTEAIAAGRGKWQVAGIEVRASADVAEKIWTKDGSAWPRGEDDPALRLGWLNLPDAMEGRLQSLETFARGVVDDGVETVVLLGMGGSSLAPEVFSRTFGSKDGYPSLVVLDSTHPEEIARVRAELDLERSLFLVSSKSGTTIETLSLYRHFRALVSDASRFVAITDPGGRLEALAKEEGFRSCFLNPPDIGGRYSALSYYGLVPAALIGADMDGLVWSAHEMVQACERCVPASHNPGLVIGTAMGELASRGRDKLTFRISERIGAFGDWVEQLIAESTGKQGRGIVPIVGEPAADPSDYGDDRAFVYLRLDGDDSQDGFVASLIDGGHPVVSARVAAPIDLGGEIFRWEFATAVAGAVLGVNAFDQPDVEAAKRASLRALQGPSAEMNWEEEDPDELFADVEPGELGALLLFAPRTQENAQLLAAARQRLLLGRGVATITGFGPRYLHSTGQLLKGGPARLRALVVLDPPERDEPIPGADHGFARLLTAQALGDVHALRQAGRRVAKTSLAALKEWAEKGS